MVLTTVNTVIVIVLGVIGVIGAVALVAAYFKTKTADTAIENYKKLRASDEQLQKSYKDRLDESDRRITDLERKHERNLQTIATLQNEINIVKNIPLHEIVTTQKQILDILQVQSEALKALAEKG